MVQAKIKDAQEMARRAKLEITGIARQYAWHLALPLDYWDHKSERGPRDCYVIGSVATSKSLLDVP